jgi:aspartyl-tRNA(Asn)/glutamyl-tRNA(Gln) amidotransferase subunit A
MTNLLSLSLSQASGLIQRREITSVELVQACLERIERLDPRLNSFLTVIPELAMRQALQADTEIRLGQFRGALHGIPVALKDLYETQGVRTTAGSLFFSDYIPTVDAIAVQHLRQAGAVLLGKLNMHEIALGVTNENPHFGDCCNPWDLRRITGGSSGGSGAALAAGLCLGSLGSDTGGSIRIPAALCGVVGLKPTRGRVSLRGVIPLSWNLDHAGPMARRVGDVAILLQAIAGDDPGDPACEDIPVEDYLIDLEHGVRGWRIALANDEYFTDPEVVEKDVSDAVQRAGNVFSSLGVEVHPVTFPNARQAALANGLMTTSDAAAFHRQRLQEQPLGFGPDVRQRLQNGAAYTSTEYILARQTQSELRRQFTLFFKDYDLLLTPATPITAPVRGSADAVERARLLTRFTAPFNLTGLPAVSVPCGFDAQGLPIGLQLIGPPWAEKRLLQAAHAYEQATPWNLLPPGFD